MSLLPENLIDLHRYEHDLVQGVLARDALRPVPMMPNPDTWPDPLEAGVLRHNQAEANALYQLYSEFLRLMPDAAL